MVTWSRLIHHNDEEKKWKQKYAYAPFYRRHKRECMYRKLQGTNMTLREYLGQSDKMTHDL